MPVQPRLKVYRTHSGFYDIVVAAPSQKAALAAWGTGQNLFQEGLASVVGDDEIIQLAKSKPGIVLRRMYGSKDQFSVAPRPPRVTDLPKADRPKPGSRQRSPSPDKKAIAAARAELANIERERKAALANAENRRKAFDAEEEASKRLLAEKAAAARKALASAQKTRK